MTIRNIDHFIASLPDWAILDGCFGMTRISPSDIDGWVERNGRSLFLEHKLPGQPLKGGQAIGFRALAAQGNMVIVYWGCDDDVSAIESFGPGILHRKRKDATLADLRQLVSDWYAWADSQRQAA